MSNRSRRERRAAQAQRAAEAHDPAAFEAMIAKSPETAAQHLARALSALPEAEASALDAVAARLCSLLRQGGKLEAAHKLASAIEGRSPRLRLESALAAFALGLDAEAARAAAGDERVLAVMAPLLDVNLHRGADAPAAKRRAPPKPAALRALHDVAAAAKAAMGGKTTAARAALRRVPNTLTQTLAVEDMSAAIDLEKPTQSSFKRAVLRLRRSAVVRASPRAAESVVHTLARFDEPGALMIAKDLAVPEEALRALQVRAAHAAAKPSASPDARAARVSATLAFAGSAGAQLFDPEHRAAACLYEGFAVLRSDPKRASRAFDRAIELGGDMIEALRGKLLLASSDMGKPCPDCGRNHEADARDHGREVGAAGDRLARALRRVPAGAPFAVVASVIAAGGWDTNGDTKSALASVAAARAAAGPTMRDELDLCEARIHSSADPERAQGLLDDMLARDPASIAAWRLKIEIARDDGDEDLADTLVAQAAAATNDPELEGLARRVLRDRGEVKAFDGFVPGEVTAGALAAEIAPLLRKPGAVASLPEIAVACRAKLSEDARVAFDVALLDIEAAAGKHAEAAARLAALVMEWWSSPKALGTLAACTWLFGLEEELPSSVRALASRADAGPALAVLTDVAIAARDLSIAEALLRLGAVVWTRSDLALRKTAIASLRQRSSLRDPRARFNGAPNPDVAGNAVEALLSPEFRLDQDDERDDVDGDDVDDLLPGELPEVLRAAFEIIGVSEDEVLDAGPEKIGQIGMVMSRMTSGARMPSIGEMRRAVRRILDRP